MAMVPKKAAKKTNKMRMKAVKKARRSRKSNLKTRRILTKECPMMDRKWKTVGKVMKKRLSRKKVENLS